MAKTNLGDLIGGWAFLIGVILAIIIGLFPNAGTSAMMTTLVVVGILIGLLNVADKEVTPFLLSGVVLVLVSQAGIAMLSRIPYVNGILMALLTIFVPATVIVAVKNVLGLAKR
jgi:hypothetical protein